jgi:hypothetical protein
MANEVYANGREISCKKADGKAICAFPDVCFTPPQTPATPPGVPIPYPNTGMAKDTTSGSKKVKISGKEIMLRNKSYFKKSMGDEAGCAPKKGILTSTNRGKVYFNSWSMNVKFEGQNVVRHLDVTTHNHRSVPGNTPIWPYLDGMAMADYLKKCAKDVEKEMTACSEYTPYGTKDPCDELPPHGNMRDFGDAGVFADHVAAHDCLAARRCQLVPKEPSGKQPGCCAGQTGHHLVEGASFEGISGITKYEYGKAPCVCVEGYNQSFGTHGIMHTFQSTAAPNTPTQNYSNARDTGASALNKTFPESECNEDCIKAQIDAYHKKNNQINDNTQINTIKTGRRKSGSMEEAERAVSTRSEQVRSIKSGQPAVSRANPSSMR